MEPRAGRLAHGAKVRDVGAAVEVGVHAAAREVGRRNHRDRLALDVDAMGQAALVDAGEARPGEARGHGGEVQEDAGLAA